MMTMISYVCIETLQECIFSIVWSSHVTIFSSVFSCDIFTGNIGHLSLVLTATFSVSHDLAGRQKHLQLKHCRLLEQRIYRLNDF